MNQACNIPGCDRMGTDRVKDAIVCLPCSRAIAKGLPVPAVLSTYKRPPVVQTVVDEPQAILDTALDILGADYAEQLITQADLDKWVSASELVVGIDHGMEPANSSIVIVDHGQDPLRIVKVQELKPLKPTSIVRDMSAVKKAKAVILEELAAGPKTPKELNKANRASRSSNDDALRQLRAEGKIRAQGDGKKRFYRLAGDPDPIVVAPQIVKVQEPKPVGVVQDRGARAKAWAAILEELANGPRTWAELLKVSGVKRTSHGEALSQLRVEGKIVATGHSSTPIFRLAGTPDPEPAPKAKPAPSSIEIPAPSLKENSEEQPQAQVRELEAMLDRHVDQGSRALARIVGALGEGPSDLVSGVEALAHRLEELQERHRELAEDLADTKDQNDDTRVALVTVLEESQQSHDLYHAALAVLHSRDRLQVRALEAEATVASLREQLIERIPPVTRQDLQRRFDAWRLLEDCISWRDSSGKEQHPVMLGVPEQLEDELDLAIRARLEDIAFGGLGGTP